MQPTKIVVSCNGKVEKEFNTLHSFFDYDPDGAAWLVRHPHSTFFEYDHGKGLVWRVEAKY